MYYDSKVSNHRYFLKLWFPCKWCIRNKIHVLILASSLPSNSETLVHNLPSYIVGTESTYPHIQWGPGVRSKVELGPELHHNAQPPSSPGSSQSSRQCGLYHHQCSPTPPELVGRWHRLMGPPCLHNTKRKRWQIIICNMIKCLQLQQGNAYKVDKICVATTTTYPIISHALDKISSWLIIYNMGRCLSQDDPQLFILHQDKNYSFFIKHNKLCITNFFIQYY